MNSKEHEALKLALEALKDNQHLVADNERHVYVMEYNSIIEKCEEALAQPEQEPVAWMDIDEKGVVSGLRYWSEPDNRYEVALYTTPPTQCNYSQRSQAFKPLTQTEVVDAFCSLSHDIQFVSVFEKGVRFAEAAHGIRSDEL